VDAAATKGSSVDVVGPGRDGSDYAQLAGGLDHLCRQRLRPDNDRAAGCGERLGEGSVWRNDDLGNLFEALPRLNVGQGPIARDPRSPRGHVCTLRAARKLG
jgi:hypothetical protein